MVKHLFILIIIYFILPFTSQVCNDSTSCYPPIDNLAVDSRITSVTASDSCGQNGVELACPPLRDCYNCSSGDYPASYAIDNNSSSWWQSSNGQPVVNLALTFSAPVLVAEINIIWETTRPQSMLLEYSTDYGQTYDIYQYYSRNCTIFQLTQIGNTNSQPLLDTQVICTSEQSSIYPYQNGVIFFYPSTRFLNGVSNFTASALNYMLITNLRVMMFGFNIIFGIQNSDNGYYAIREWQVSGTCFCNGHAEMCDPNDPTICNCQHQTEGNNCERCQRLFTAKNWLPATITSANPCMECKCNSHANSCTPGSGGGVCQNCTHNTTGNNCQTCLPSFFLSMNLPTSDPLVCIPCECNEDGSEGNTCDYHGGCTCRGNVMGSKCDKCNPGYFNLISQRGCEACKCNLLGSENQNCHATTGVCTCKTNVESEKCDSCKDGYYNLSVITQDGCENCTCNLGGAISQICNKNNGVCTCRRGLQGVNCDQLLSGYFLPDTKYLTFEAESGNNLLIGTPGFSNFNTLINYSGFGLVRLEHGASLTLTIQVRRLFIYRPILRYYSEDNRTIQLNIRLFAISGTSDGCDMKNRQQTVAVNGTLTYIRLMSVCLSGSPSQYSISITTTQHSIWIDSFQLTPDYPTNSTIYPLLSAKQQLDVDSCLSVTNTSVYCEQALFSVTTEFYNGTLECGCDPRGSTSTACNKFGGDCSCKQGVQRRVCDVCSPGYHKLSANGCISCMCNANGSIDHPCDINTGQCFCKKGVFGINCDRCMDGYFNLTSEGCENCTCSQYSRNISCDLNGRCYCKTGVSGEKCDKCQDNFFWLSNSGCLNCSCDAQNSVSPMCHKVLGNCTCRRGFSGYKCQDCLPGNYITSDEGFEECKNCLCYQKASNCTSKSFGYSIGKIESDFTQPCFNKSDCSQDWSLYGGLFSGNKYDEFITWIIITPFPAYWIAPAKYLGNRALSYGRLLNFSIFSEDLSTEMTYVNDVDIIMVGVLYQTEYRIVAKFNQTVQEMATNFIIPLDESYDWRKNDITGPRAKYPDILLVLTNLTSLQIQARYSEATVAESSIEYFILETLVPDPSAINEVTVGKCDCPEPYNGTFCQECSQGYFRSSEKPFENCTRCNCYGHTEDCDPITGKCLNCKNNTLGFNCSICGQGYYGDATQGTEQDCQRCSCPLVAPAENNVSPTCSLSQDNQLICDACPPEYNGTQCERCVDGYFGSPKLPGSICTDCNCSGNIDPTSPNNCNTTTGKCLLCLNNTAGYMCEVCAPGFFGNALNDTCQACQCNSNGRVDNNCHHTSGVCNCKPNVVGGQCDRCARGFYGIYSSSCIPCGCCSNGSISSDCDMITGDCACKSNVGGGNDNKCCQCSADSYKFKYTGCSLCGCNLDGSVNASCDQNTGNCTCLEGVTGVKCDKCNVGYSGTPPSCIKCPECFDYWITILQSIRETLNNLTNRLETFLSNYSSLTVEEIEKQINKLNLNIITINSLSQEQFDTTELSRLEIEFMGIQMGLQELANRITDIEKSLNKSEKIINKTITFDGNVETSPGSISNSSSLSNELDAILASVQNANNTGVSIAKQINATYKKLLMANDSINEIRTRVEMANNKSRIVRKEIARTNMTGYEFFKIFRKNTDKLSKIANYTNITHYILINVNHINEASQLKLKQATNISASAYKLARIREAEANASNNSITRLLNYAEIVYSLSVTANSSTSELNENLQNLSNKTTTLQNQLLVKLSTVKVLEKSAKEIDTIINNTLELKIPDAKRAKYLEQMINNITVPQDKVDNITEDAERSLQIANETYQLAKESRTKVKDASNLLIDIMTNLDLLNVTQIMTNMSIIKASDALQLARNTITDINENNQSLVNITNDIMIKGDIIDEISRNVTAIGDKILNDTKLALYNNKQTCNSSVELIKNLSNAEKRIENSSQSLDLDILELEINQTDIMIVLDQINEDLRIIENITEESLVNLIQNFTNLQDDLTYMEAEINDLEKKFLVLEGSINELANLYPRCVN